MRNFVCASVVLAAGLFAGACQETINTAEPAGGIPQTAAVNDKRVVSDTSLNNSARVVGVSEGKTPDGLLKVQVAVTNTTRSSKTCYYQFEWLDDTGMAVVPAVTGYSEQQIVGKETKYLVGIAPKPNVTSFRIKLKED